MIKSSQRGRIFLSSIALGWLVLRCAAASITGGEYYIGSDPGSGNGVALSVSESGSMSAAFETAALAVEELGAGTYDVGVRVKDDQGRWSGAIIKRFSKQESDFELADGVERSGNANQGRAELIAGLGSFGGGAAGEYYIGSDPGAGNGVALSVSESGSMSAAFETAALAVEELVAGTYDVGVRVKDDQGRWSGAIIKRFSKQESDFELADGVERSGNANQGRAGLIAGLGSFGGGAAGEYYIGSDPGAGNGVALSVSESGSMSAAFETAALAVEELVAGTYDVGVRVKDDQGRWSGAIIKRFSKQESDFELADGVERSGNANQGRAGLIAGLGSFGGGAAGEYYIGSDPGAGNGVALSVSESGSMSAAFETAALAVEELVAGTYDVGVRVKDDQGRWSGAIIKRFSKQESDFELADGI